MSVLKNTIPYCAGCKRKEKRPGLKTGEYYCEVVSDTPMKGIVTGDIDGTKCVEMGLYLTL